jgi:perosamine synthetase
MQEVTETHNMVKRVKMQIRLFKPSVGQEELSNIRLVFDRAWLGLGPLVAEFEKEWSEYLNVSSSVGVNSGTAALHLALMAYGFRPGSKVLVPAITFVSTATAVLYNHLKPVFVDVDPDTLSISMRDLETKLDSKCVALIPVHFGGHPVPMEQLMEIAKRHRLAVIEDCAHCAGGAYKGKKLGTWGDIGCFSFEEKKCMTTGDGGMLSSDAVDLIEPVRAYRWVGIDKDTWRRSAGYTDTQSLDVRHWYYEVSKLGYKYNMNDLMAAIGLAQLKKLDRMNERRRVIIRRYLDGIKDCQQIRPLLPYALQDAAYWIFGVRCNRRDDLIAHLKQKGIATGVHYMPIPLHPLFRSYDKAIPAAKQVWQTILTLPLFPDLTDVEVDYVVDALCEFDRQ